MTYKHLKAFLEENCECSEFSSVKKLKNNFGSKLIFIVGEDASNTASFLSSIMSTKNTNHSRYINAEHVELKDRFLQDGMPVHTNEITTSANLWLRRTKKCISNEELLVGVAIETLRNDYLLIEMSHAYCKSLFKSTKIVPYALLLASKNDEQNEEIINLAPGGIKEIISSTSKDNFDYISTALSVNGTRVSFASPNKITYSTSKLMSGTQFFYFNDLFRIPTINLFDVPPAALAIEAARILFEIPNHRIRKGLIKANLIYNFEIHSTAPIVLLRAGKGDFKLHNKLKFKIITENDDIEIPSENTIFGGRQEFIDRVKETIKK